MSQKRTLWNCGFSWPIRHSGFPCSLFAGPSFFSAWQKLSGSQAPCLTRLPFHAQSSALSQAKGCEFGDPGSTQTSYLAFLHADHMAPTSRHCCTQNSGMVVGVSFGDRKLGRLHFQLVLQKRDQTKVMGGISLVGHCLGKVRNISSNHLWAPRSLPSASCHCKILFKKQMDGILPKTTSYCFFSHLYFQITEYYLTFLDLTTFFCMCISCFQYGQSYCNTDEEPQALVGQ